MNRSSLRRFAILMLLACCCGCRLLQSRPALEPTPPVFTAVPSLEQIAAAVNGNAERVRTMQSRDARLVLRGIPAVTLDIAYEQPQRFRLRAGTGFTGQELDLGSNDELFWFWTKQSPQPAIFFARHDRFATSPNKNMIPIEPLWIIDGLGIPRFDPRLQHEGPTPAGKHLVEVRTRIPTPQGETLKVTTVHDQYGWVVRQQWFDPAGRMIVAAVSSDHEFYPLAQAALPRKASIEIAQAGMTLNIETSGWNVNQPLGDPQALFTLPQDQLPGYRTIDIAAPSSEFPTIPVAAPPGNTLLPYGVNVPPTAATAPRMRGFDGVRR